MAETAEPAAGGDKMEDAQDATLTTGTTGITMEAADATLGGDLGMWVLQASASVEGLGHALKSICFGPQM